MGSLWASTRSDPRAGPHPAPAAPTPATRHDVGKTIKRDRIITARQRWTGEGSADTGAISEPACARSGTTVEVPAEAAGARLRPRCRARRRVRLVVRPGSIRCCRPGPAARDPGSARSPPPSGAQPGAPQRPAPRRPTPGPERPAPRARSDRAPVQPVPETASTCRNSVALIGYVPAPDRQRVRLEACRSPACRSR